MRKKELMKTAFFLILYSFIAKILSLLVRIVIARSISEEAMTLYSLAAPTMIIMITLSQMGIPATLSKLLSDNSKEKRKPVSAGIFLSIVNNILLTIFYALAIPLLATVILKQSQIIEVLYAITPLIPLIAMTGLLKGYFIGLQQHNPPSIAQIMEELVRGGFILLTFYYFDIANPITMATIAMTSIAVGEIASLATLVFYLKHRKQKWLIFTRSMRQIDRHAIDSVLQISLPITGSRLVGSIITFLEPMVLVYRSLSPAMTIAYGQLHGYVMPVITMPSFLTLTLSGWLLPSFTYQYSSGRQKQAKHTFLVTLTLCLLIGTFFAMLSFFFPEWILHFLYHKTVGAATLKALALPFVIYTAQPVLSSILHAMNQSKQSFMDTLLGSLLRITSLAYLLPLIGSSAIAISLTLGMLCTTLLHGIRVLRTLFLNHK